MDTDIIKQTVTVLNKGGLILYPTDTVWGIGCDATNEIAVQRVFKLKQRSETKSMILLIESPQMIQPYISSLTPFAQQLLTENETPQTVILPHAHGLAPSVLPPEKTVAVRCPKHEFCLHLLHAFGKPLVSTSANISGQPAACTYSDIHPLIIQGVDFIVPALYEKGATKKPSRIVTINKDDTLTLLRP